MKYRMDSFSDNEKLKAIFPISEEAILREIKNRVSRGGDILGSIEVEIDVLTAIPRVNRTPEQINALRHLEMLWGSLKSEVLQTLDLGVFVAHRSAEAYLTDMDSDLVVQIESGLESQTPQPYEGWDVLVAEVLRRYRARRAYHVFTASRLEFEVMHEVGRRIWRSSVVLKYSFADQDACEAIERTFNMRNFRYLYDEHGQAAIDLFQRRMAMAMANEASVTRPDEAQKSRDEAGPVTPPDYAN